MRVADKKKICVIGSLNVDQSMNVVAFPKKGETVMGKGLRYANGGKGANQAVAAGLLGGNVEMLGCVGNDNFGRLQAENLKASCVKADNLKVTDEDATGMAVIYIDENGDNCIVLASGANGHCDISYIKEHRDVIASSDYILLQMEIPFDAVEYAVDAAYALDKQVVLNPAPAPETPYADAFLKKLTYITPNETELAKLTGLKCETEEEIKAASETLLNKGVKNVLVTLGERGVMLTNESGSVIYPTCPKKPVDTTAAGDTFNGAFLVGLSEGMPVEQAINLGNIASSLAVMKRGAQDSIPTREEADAALSAFRSVSQRV